MSAQQHSTLEQFQTHGWLRVERAFEPAAAAAMCEAIWAGLARQGIERDKPSTWTKDRPEHLQHLKSNPVFRAIGSPRTISAINEVLEGQAWEVPDEWGAFFLQFPNDREWSVPSSGWHLDADYTGELKPPTGVKVHAMLSNVEPRGGGMNVLSGSHRLVHKWFSEHPVAPRARGAQLRKSLQQHPYLRDLCSDGDVHSRLERFFTSTELVDGIPLRVIENTAAAGDVILMHPLLLHAPPAAHTGREPRFLLNKDIQLPQMQARS